MTDHRLPKDSKDSRDVELNDSNNFVTPSLLLFLDNVLVASGSWIYWITISRITTASEVGVAVTVYGLVVLITTLTQLGIEYPLLKKSSIQDSRVLGTALVIELSAALVSILLVFFFTVNLQGHLIRQFEPIYIGLILIMSIQFVFRFGLIGISKSQTILIVDLVGLGTKFVTGISLVSLSYGALGILIAYLIEAVIVTFGFLIFVNKIFSFKIGNIQSFKEIIMDSFINTPAKWSKVIIFSLSVVLLGFMQISPSEVGVFYIDLMITFAIASFSVSMAYVVIPYALSSKINLSTCSIRISLSLTAVFVVALLVKPESILYLIGYEYISGAATLTILAVSIIPFAVTVNLISLINTSGNRIKLILTGMVQVVTFFFSFFIFVPLFQTTGAAISILIACVSSSLFLILLTEHGSLRYILSTGLSVIVGYTIGKFTELVIGSDQRLLIIFASVVATLVSLYGTKNISMAETNFFLRGILQRK